MNALKGKKKNKEQFIQPNHLFQKFIVATINTYWSGDDTTLFFKDNRRLSVLFFIDLASKKIIHHSSTIKDFNSSHVLKNVTTLIFNRITYIEQNDQIKLIIHTDRDIRFTSKK